MKKELRNKIRKLLEKELVEAELDELNHLFNIEDKLDKLDEELKDAKDSKTLLDTSLKDSLIKREKLELKVEQLNKTDLENTRTIQELQVIIENLNKFKADQGLAIANLKIEHEKEKLSIIRETTDKFLDTLKNMKLVNKNSD